MMTWRMPGHAILTIASLLLLAWSQNARAMETCQGSLAATLLQPLPNAIVAALDMHDRSARNVKLADRFMAGVREAGVAVGPQPNLWLHVNVSVLGNSRSSPGRTVERNYPELSGLPLGSQVVLPPLPSAGISTSARRAPPTPPLLFLRIDATEGSATRISWVASVQCRMVGTDDGRLAQELGRVIGGALGQRIERQPL